MFQHQELDTDHGLYMIDAIHDADSGMEIVCVRLDNAHDDSLSCFQTGRKWQ